MATESAWVSQIAKSGLKPLGVTLVAGRFGFQCGVHISRWLRGDVSGKRCTKMIIDDVGELLGNVFGGFLGATYGARVGAVFGPMGAAVGTVTGGVIGSVMGTEMVHTWFKLRTEAIFDLPKEEAVENAYRFFGLHPRCSNAKINSRYRHLARWYHPDKGGDRKKWNELEIHFGILHAARK